MSKLCIHYYVSGHVQGVFYRAHTKKQAIELGLTGWVKNLKDGRVEVLACGERPQLKALEAWLLKGPPAAHVEGVTNEELPWEEYSGFNVM